MLATFLSDEMDVNARMESLHLKGAYLEWAPQLLDAEKWHKEQNEKLKKTHDKDDAKHAH